jgi:ribonuclease HI
VKHPNRQVRVCIDGGARGNPGPAGAGVVITTADGRKTLFQAGFFLGRQTNNAAEYHALLEGLDRATAMGAEQVEVVSDSELLIRQMNGQYRVKNEALKSLYQEARVLVRRLSRCTFRHVPRGQNRQPDRLVNRAIDLEGDVGDAEAAAGGPG